MRPGKMRTSLPLAGQGIESMSRGDLNSLFRTLPGDFGQPVSQMIPS